VVAVEKLTEKEKIEEIEEIDDMKLEVVFEFVEIVDTEGKYMDYNLEFVDKQMIYMDLDFDLDSIIWYIRLHVFKKKIINKKVN